MMMIEGDFTPPSWLDMTPNFRDLSHDFCLVLFNKCMGSWALHGPKVSFFDAVTLFCEVLSPPAL